MFIEKHLDFQGNRLFYWTNSNSDRPTMFFMHGAGCDHQMFEAQFKRFSADFNLIAWDARWHGKSNGAFTEFNMRVLLDDALAVMAAENIRKAVVVGQSLGGNIAQELALRHPDQVAKLVVIDSTRNIQRLTWLEKWGISMAVPIFKLYSWPRLVKDSVRASSLRPEVREYMTRTMNKVGKERFIQIFAALSDILRGDEEAAFQAPVCLICGAKDATGNIRKAMAAWGSEPGVALHVIPDASHNANQDAPDVVNEVIAAFVG